MKISFPRDFYHASSQICISDCFFPTHRRCSSPIIIFLHLFTETMRNQQTSRRVRIMSHFAMLLTLHLAMMSSAVHASEGAHSRISQLVWSENSDTHVRLPTPREPSVEEKAQYLRSSHSETRHLSFWSNLMSEYSCNRSCLCIPFGVFVLTACSDP